MAARTSKIWKSAKKLIKFKTTTTKPSKSFRAKFKQLVQKAVFCFLSLYGQGTLLFIPMSPLCGQCFPQSRGCDNYLYPDCPNLAQLVEGCLVSGCSIGSQVIQGVRLVLDPGYIRASFFCPSSVNTFIEPLFCMVLGSQSRCPTCAQGASA